MHHAVRFCCWATLGSVDSGALGSIEISDNGTSAWLRASGDMRPITVDDRSTWPRVSASKWLMKASSPPGGQLAGSRTSAIEMSASGRSASLLPASSSSHVSSADGSLAMRAMGMRAIGIAASPARASGMRAIGMRAMGMRAIGMRAIGVVSGAAVPLRGALKSMRAIGADLVDVPRRS